MSDPHRPIPFPPRVDPNFIPLDERLRVEPALPRNEDRLTELPWRDKAFYARPNAAGVIPTGQFVDGVRDLGFVPITLMLTTTNNFLSDIGLGAATGYAPPGPGNTNYPQNGDVVIQIRGLLPGQGAWTRRFAIPPLRTLYFDVTPYVDVAIEVLRSTLTGGSAVSACLRIGR